jgi:hemerythrin-like domain-containing protein
MTAAAGETSATAYANGDGYFRIKFLMERAHETLLAGLDSVRRQADDDHSADLKNWLGYLGAWADSVSHHHKTEEKTLFPKFKSNGIEVDVCSVQAFDLSDLQH